MPPNSASTVRRHRTQARRQRSFRPSSYPRMHGTRRPVSFQSAFSEEISKDVVDIKPNFITHPPRFLSRALVIASATLVHCSVFDFELAFSRGLFADSPQRTASSMRLNNWNSEPGLTRNVPCVICSMLREMLSRGVLLGQARH